MGLRFRLIVAAVLVYAATVVKKVSTIAMNPITPELRRRWEVSESDAAELETLKQNYQDLLFMLREGRKEIEALRAEVYTLRREKEELCIRLTRVFPVEGIAPLSTSEHVGK
jgi:hypothetical protein